MTYNEKKSLYESIMKEIAKTVKHQINEADENNKSSNKKELTPREKYNVENQVKRLKETLTMAYMKGDNVTPTWILSYCDFFRYVVKFDDKELLKKLQDFVNKSDINSYFQKKYAGRMCESK